MTKIAQDLINYVYFKSYGTKVIRTRTLIMKVQGEKMGISSYAYQIARIEKDCRNLKNKSWNLTDKRNFTHAKDITRAYWLASEKCKVGELYLIGNEKILYLLLNKF